MRLRKAYFDIEATYTGPIKFEEDTNGFFKDYKNWKFFFEKEHNGKKGQYRGIVGIMILDFDLGGNTNIHKIVDKKFVQLVGEDITKDRLMCELEGITDIIGYHCRTKPNWKGYTGYDFGVINGQFDVILDDLPGVTCTDLELTAQSAKMYGGLKGIEMCIPTVPRRKSGIEDGAAEEKLLWKIAFCDDENKKKEAWKKALLYNREDVANLVYIEQYLRKIIIV